MNDTRKSKTGTHLDAVDGLRGAAAMLIVVYHCFTNAGQPEWRSARAGGINLLRPLTDGWAGVNLFLVLSGFCLYWPYARKPDRSVSYGTHMKRRSLRILPAYYASLLLVPLMYLGMRGFGAAATWPTLAGRAAGSMRCCILRCCNHFPWKDFAVGMA